MRYFDHNATSPLLPQARQAWLEAEAQFFGNPSSPHRVGARAERALTQARERLALFLGCSPLDLIWTSGATESNNAVFHHFARVLEPSVEVWVSAIEHPCVLRAAARHFPGRHRLLPVGRGGLIELDFLGAELRRQRPGLVALLAANNETGVLQPWAEVLALCRSCEVPFFCDAAQWLGKLPAKGLGACDFVSGCAHKFGGPKGVGFLKCPAEGPFHALIVGGGQEEGRRAGTENVPGALAMVAALEVREAALALGEEEVRIAWRERFELTLRQTLPGAQIVGSPSPRLWNTVSAVMPEADSQQRWVVKLDKLGFAVSTGSACASGKEQPSHVLASMGYGTGEAARVLRFSSGWETGPEDWEELAKGLAQVHQALELTSGRTPGPLPLTASTGSTG